MSEEDRILLSTLRLKGEMFINLSDLIGLTEEHGGSIGASDLKAICHNADMHEQGLPMQEGFTHDKDIIIELGDKDVKGEESNPS